MKKDQSLDEIHKMVETVGGLLTRQRLINEKIQEWITRSGYPDDPTPRVTEDTLDEKELYRLLHFLETSAQEVGSLLEKGLDASSKPLRDKVTENTAARANLVYYIKRICG